MHECHRYLSLSLPGNAFFQGVLQGCTKGAGLGKVRDRSGVGWDGFEWHRSLEMLFSMGC
eukprot:14319667-Alexandrium_andersonii.AAC.1